MLEVSQERGRRPSGRLLFVVCPRLFLPGHSTWACGRRAKRWMVCATVDARPASKEQLARGTQADRPAVRGEEEEEETVERQARPHREEQHGRPTDQPTALAVRQCLATGPCLRRRKARHEAGRREGGVMMTQTRERERDNRVGASGAAMRPIVGQIGNKQPRHSPGLGGADSPRSASWQRAGRQKGVLSKSVSLYDLERARACVRAIVGQIWPAPAGSLSPAGRRPLLFAKDGARLLPQKNKDAHGRGTERKEYGTERARGEGRQCVQSGGRGGGVRGEGEGGGKQISSRALEGASRGPAGPTCCRGHREQCRRRRLAPNRIPLQRGEREQRTRRLLLSS